MSQKTKSMMENVAQDWKGLTISEAVGMSDLIESVSVTDSMIQITLESAPSYITEACEIHQVRLHYPDDEVEQRFPFGFDMSGQKVEHQPSTAVVEDDSSILKIVCGIETSSGSWNTTTLRVPLELVGGEVTVDTDSTRAGIDEQR